MKKKKIVDKFIENIEVPSFDKIANRINYDEYVSKKFNSKKTLTMVLTSCIVACALALVFLIDALSVKIYNDSIDEYQRQYYLGDQLVLKKVQSKEEINLINRKYKKTIGERIFNSFNKNVNGVSSSIALDTPISEENNNAPSNSYETNTQVKGIEEADVSKCDGEYIYTLNQDSLIIYDLSSNNVIASCNNVSLKDYNSMYVHKNDIIVLGKQKSTILQFVYGNIEVKNTFDYYSYCDSRVLGDYLYLICNLGNVYNEVTVKDAYYDGYTDVDTVYSIVKYNLNDYTYEQVKNLNRGNATLYFSENHIYLATNVYVPSIYEKTICSRYISILSIFDLNLSPIAAIKMKGSVLNQFSMDEYNGYIRVVTTNVLAPKNQINSISIYDLSSLELVGQLSQGIGIDNQIVKSVRFSENTCYIVTYENRDPLYELDLSDVTSPIIVSSYASPGYSSYLHSFKVGEEKYLFGVGLLDDQASIKVSVYKDDEETSQIGHDFVFSPFYVYPIENASKENLIMINYHDINYQVINNHKALFITQDGDDLYLGMGVSLYDYYILKISVNEEGVISLYKHVSLEKSFAYSRCYLYEGKLYITGEGTIIIENFN